MGIKHGEADLLSGREALNTQRPEKNLAARLVERSQQEMERIILSTCCETASAGTKSWAVCTRTPSRPTPVERLLMQRAAPAGWGTMMAELEVTPEESPLAPHLARDPHRPDGLLHRLSHRGVVEPRIDRSGRRAISVPKALADDRQARSPNRLPATKSAPQIVQSQGASGLAREPRGRGKPHNWEPRSFKDATPALFGFHQVSGGTGSREHPFAGGRLLSPLEYLQSFR